MKRKLSFFLAVLMLVAVMCCAPLSVSAEAKLITVYFENNWIWKDVFFHSWGSSLGTNTDWGKGKVELIGKAENGHEVYKAVIGSDATGIIFAGKSSSSGKSNQSPDIADFYDGACISMDYKNGKNTYNITDIANVLPDLGGTDTPAEPVNEEGYYLVGKFSGVETWFVDENSSDRMLRVNPSNEAEYMIDYTLAEGDELKVVHFDGFNITKWYSGGDNYVVSAEEAGDCTLYFIPEGNSYWDYNYIYVGKQPCKHEFNSTGVCTLCGGVEEGKIAGVAGYSLTLEGNIGVNFFLGLSEDVKNDETAKVQFTFAGVATEVLVSDAEVEDGLYKFTAKVPAKDMATDIKCKVVSESGESEIFTQSVKGYAKNMFDNYEEYSSDAIHLTAVMLNYGAAAQEYFSYNTGNLANNLEFMTEDMKYTEVVDFSSNPGFDIYSEEGIALVGVTLSLKSETAFKLYFSIDESVDTSSLTATVNGAETALKKNGNCYELKIDNIPAQNLYDNIDVEIGGFSVACAPMSYAKMAQEQGNERLLPVLYALEDYCNAACNY